MQEAISQPTDLKVEAPYDLALRAGAIVLEERPQGNTILVLRECPNIDIEQISLFLLHDEHAKYLRDIQAYLGGTAGLTQPRIVEDTATAIDNRGRLYGRGPCAQRLPRKARLLIFGNTHQEIDMIGAFYEIMRRICNDEQLPDTHKLRDALAQLLGFLPREHLLTTLKRHPLIVMNAGAREASTPSRTSRTRSSTSEPRMMTTMMHALCKIFFKIYVLPSAMRK
jgi:hypothetical protein